jgi:uncharacterized membrane protein
MTDASKSRLPVTEGSTHEMADFVLGAKSVLMMGLAQAAEGAGPGMTMMGSGMMAACVVFGLLILTLLVLAILALIKYLRSGK